MFLGTHACIPLLSVGLVDTFRLNSKKSPVLKNKQFYLLGLAGILPDILWPHTSMHARLTSWTHTIWFLILSFPVIYLLAKKIIKQNYLTFVILFWTAGVLHVLTDVFSGEVSLFYPIQKVIGNRLIPWPVWMYSDITFVSVTIILLILRRRLLIKRFVQVEDELSFNKG